MNNRLHTWLLLIFVSVLLLACNGSKKKTEKNLVIANSSISYINSPNGNQFEMGKPVNIELVMRSIPEDLDSVLFYVDQRLVYYSTEKKEKYIYSYTDTSDITGEKKIKTVVLKKNGEREEQNTGFALFSNIIPVEYTFQIAASFPHDMNAYTQGLVIDNGLLYEGTGLEGKSELRLVDKASGSIKKQISLDSRYFGEGITVFENSIYQITYRTRKGFVYDKNTFEKEREFTYDTEGWGLTHNGTHLIYSDGSHKLYFLDPQTLEKVKTLEVYDNYGPQILLNELEFIKGEIWANVYQTDLVVRIDPATGKVLGRINFSGILKPEDVHPRIDVLNGIAYDSKQDKIYITGKNYPKMWEVKITAPVQ